MELRKLLVIIGIIPLVVLFGGLYTENKKKLFYISTLIVIVFMILPKSYVDSVYVAGTTTIVTVFSSAIIGYGLARFKFKGINLGSKALFSIFKYYFQYILV